MSTTNRIPTDALKAARKDPRIVKIIVYVDGWVPNAYTHRARGTYHFWRRLPVDECEGPRRWTHNTGQYDRKKSFGIGPWWVATSAHNGKLASG